MRSLSAMIEHDDHVTTKMIRSVASELLGTLESDPGLGGNHFCVQYVRDTLCRSSRVSVPV